MEEFITTTINIVFSLFWIVLIILFVSEFSYNGYKEKEVGYLTYKGNKIIDFQ